jgi:hypothetical protein
MNFYRCAEILLKIKAKRDVLEVNMHLQINAAEAAAYNKIDEALQI